jgi:ankyrin repeat protein
MMSGKMWKYAAVAMIVAAGVPATAQVGGYDGVNFVRAVREGDGDKALPLLNARAGVVNARDLNGDTALTLAIARSDGTWTFFLLGRGADPNQPGVNDDTPLIVAARVGYLEAAEQLLLRKAKVDLPNRKGETALIAAVQQRRRDVVRLLLEYGANPDKSDNVAGLSARDYAKRDTRSRDILALIENAKGGSEKPKVKPVEKLDDFKL